MLKPNEFESIWIHNKGVSEIVISGTLIYF